jgi:hypothetical protein
VRRQFPLGSIASGQTAIIANRISPKSGIGQKKAIRQSQVFQKLYDDAFEVLLKFCGGTNKVS